MSEHDNRQNRAERKLQAVVTGHRPLRRLPDRCEREVHQLH